MPHRILKRKSRLPKITAFPDGKSRSLAPEVSGYRCVTIKLTFPVHKINPLGTRKASAELIWEQYFLTRQSARKIFSSFLDGCLDSRTNQVIKEHLASCPACFKEFSFQQRISTSLRVKENKPAPAEFTQKVMAQIAAQNLGSKALQPHISKSAKIFLNNLNKNKVSHLRYGIAVAVLFFLFIGTSFGLTLKYPQYSFGPLKQIVAQNKKEVAPSLPKTGLGENKKSPASISIAANKQSKAQNQGQSKVQNKESKEPTGLNKSQPAPRKVTGKKESNNKNLEVAVNIPVAKNTNPSSKYEPRVFLNQSRVSKSNLYKIKVDNLTQAQQKVHPGLFRQV